MKSRHEPLPRAGRSSRLALRFEMPNRHAPAPIVTAVLPGGGTSATKRWIVTDSFGSPTDSATRVRA